MKDSLGDEPRLTLRQEQNGDRQQSRGERDPRSGDPQCGGPRCPGAILLPAQPGSRLAAFLLMAFTGETPPDGWSPLCLYMTTAPSSPCTDLEHQQVGTTGFTVSSYIRLPMILRTSYQFINIHVHKFTY